jgi:hypothetical protein
MTYDRRMTFNRAFLILALCLAAPAAQAINLNATSVLADEGIEPTAAPPTVLDGIPLMTGLQLEGDPYLIQILPENPGTEPVVTVGILDVDDVYNFYKRALPPLGWTATTGRDYSKAGKSLHIDAHAEGKMTRVTFIEKSSSQ